MGDRLCALAVGWNDRRRGTELGDGVCNVYALPKSQDTNLCLEQVDVKLEEDISRDFLFFKTESSWKVE